MPAVTVPDWTSLERIELPDSDLAQPRPVVAVSTAPAGWRARVFRFVGPSRAGPLPSSTPSCTWTKWARSTTRPASPREHPGIPTGASKPSPT